MIAQTTIDAVKSLSITSVASYYIDVKKSTAGNYVALCPFHDDHRIGSFVLYGKTDTYKCFACGEQGDAIKFVQKKLNLSFSEAIQEIAKQNGIEIKYELRQNGYTPEQYKQKQQEKEDLYKALEHAQAYFLGLKKTSDEYLEKRLFTQDTIQAFGLGFADNSNYFTQRNKELWQKIDLVKSSEKGKYDAFRNRITIPLEDRNGRLIGFAGRAIDKEAKAKYINPTETPLYNKGSFLYNLHRAEKAIRSENFVYLVEGYPNVWRAYQEEIYNVVAAGGTALTEEQAKLIQRNTKNVVLIYDADSAGVKATHRSTEILLKLGMNVKVLQLPDGMDLDDYFKSLYPYLESLNAYQYKKKLPNNFLKGAEISWIDFKIQAFKAKGDQDTATEIDFVHHLADLILSYPDPTTQQSYVEQISKHFKGIKTSYKNKLKDLKEAEKQGENEEIKRVIVLDDETKVINARGVLATIGEFKIKILYKIAIPNSEECKWFLELTKKDKEPTTIVVPNKDFKAQNLEMLLYAKDFHLDLDEKQFKYLKEFLQKEGYKKCIEVKELGYHAQSGLFFFSNVAYHTITKKLVYPNSLNIIDLEDISYLMPYVNKEFAPKDKQACFYEEGTVTFEEVADFIMRSWGENAVLPIAYYFSSLFMDIAIARNKSFPILFLKGEGSTGKTKLANLLMDFYGQEMSKEVALAARSSAYALKDRMSSFSNVPIHVEDYSRAKDVEEMDNFVVHLYDRKFRKTKDMSGDKKGITDELPLSSMIATSNDDPKDDGSGALPTRLIYIKMNGNAHDTNKRMEFQKGLTKIESMTRSHLSIQFLNHRQLIEKEFDTYFMNFLQVLSNRLEQAEVLVPNRVITSYCAIITPMSILGDKEIVQLPDGIPSHIKLSDALLDIAFKNIIRQVNSLLSKSPLQAFWETVQGLADEANYQIAKAGTYIDSRGNERPKDININNRLIYKDYHYKVYQFHENKMTRVIDEPVLRLKFQDVYDKYFLKMKERGETKIPSSLHIKDLIRNHRSYVPDASEKELKFKDDGNGSCVKASLILKYNALREDFDLDLE